MARHKWIDTSPRFLAEDLAKQLLPGSFEHAVHHLFEHEIDLGGFAARYRNRPERGAGLPARDAASGHPLRLRPGVLSAAGASKKMSQPPFSPLTSKTVALIVIHW